jgi:MFS family permease
VSVSARAAERAASAYAVRPPTAAGSVRTRKRGTFASLANRDFRYLLAGTMALQVGSWSQTIGQGWLIHDMTRSAVQLGLIAFIRGLVVLLASPFGGYVSDALDRRRVIIGGTFLAALNGVVMTALVATGTIAVWHLYLLAAVDGMLGALIQPARQALVYDVAGEEDLTNAVALSSVGGNIMRIIGPSLGGALIGIWGVAACFVFQAVCLVAAALVSLPIRPVHQRGPRTASLMDSMLGGIAYARSSKAVVLLLLMAAIPCLLVYPYVGFVPVFASDVLHVGAFEFGVLMTAVGVGSIPGALIAANMNRRSGYGRTLVMTTATYMAMVAAFALSPSYWLAFGCLAMAGVANAIQNTLNSSLLQFNVSDEYRGRVSALYFMTGGLSPFGSLAMGGLIAVWGAPATVAGFALLAVGAVLVLGVLSPRLRAL